MIGYEQFSGLRLADLFPDNPYVRKYYSGEPANRSYDWEWLGGLWEQQHVPGVEFLYPEAGGGELGAIRISLPVPGIDDPAREVDWFGDPGKRPENAARVLALLDLPFRFHDDLATVRAAIKAAGGRILERTRRDDLQLTWRTFRCGKQERYRFEVVVHDSQGLLYLMMIREDLAERNDAGI